MEQCDNFRKWGSMVNILSRKITKILCAKPDWPRSSDTRM